MTVDESAGAPLRLGLLVKQAAAALRFEMDAVLRPLELSDAQYTCLELLAEESDLSNAELARRALVTRQSMNGVLLGLEGRQLVVRPGGSGPGRAAPARLTSAGRVLLRRADRAVADVEQLLCSGLSQTARQRLPRDLERCVSTLLDQGEADPVQ